MKALFIALAMFGILGYVGHQDQQTELFQNTITTCNASRGETDNIGGRECKQLIDQVQKDAKWEVMSNYDGTNFWIKPHNCHINTAGECI